MKYKFEIGNLKKEFKHVHWHKVIFLSLGVFLVGVIGLIIAVTFISPQSQIAYIVTYPLKHETNDLRLGWNNSCELENYHIEKLPGISFDYRPCDWKAINFVREKETGYTYLRASECTVWDIFSGCGFEGVDFSIVNQANGDPKWLVCLDENYTQLENGLYVGNSPSFIPGYGFEDIVNRRYAVRINEDPDETVREIMDYMKCTVIGESIRVKGSVIGLDAEKEYYISAEYWGADPDKADELMESLQWGE